MKNFPFSFYRENPKNCYPVSKYMAYNKLREELEEIGEGLELPKREKPTLADLIGEDNSDIVMYARIWKNYNSREWEMLRVKLLFEGKVTGRNRWRKILKLCKNKKKTIKKKLSVFRLYKYFYKKNCFNKTKL